MWATPVIRLNYSGITPGMSEFGKTCRSTSIFWRSCLPHIRSFIPCNLYSHFRPTLVLREELANGRFILKIGHSGIACDLRPTKPIQPQTSKKARCQKVLREAAQPLAGHVNFLVSTLITSRFWFPGSSASEPIQVPENLHHVNRT